MLIYIYDVFMIYPIHVRKSYLAQVPITQKSLYKVHFLYVEIAKMIENIIYMIDLPKHTNISSQKDNGFLLVIISI